MTKKSIKPYQPKNSQNILLESEVSNKTHLLSRKNQIISSISGVEFAETEIKQKNNVLLESYDGLSGFLYNTTEATKRSLEQKKSEQNTFMCVGGMGHAISVASGIALEKKKKK